MHDALDATTLADQLTSSSIELGALAERVENHARPVTGADLEGWRGPASLAVRVSLGVLERELEAVTGLLRGASNLVAAASWEVRARG